MALRPRGIRFARALRLWLRWVAVATARQAPPCCRQLAMAIGKNEARHERMD